MSLLRDLQAEFRGTYVFITHDLATAFELSTRIAIMYLGDIVELLPRMPFGRARSIRTRARWWRTSLFPTRRSA